MVETKKLTAVHIGGEIHHDVTAEKRGNHFVITGVLVVCQKKGSETGNPVLHDIPHGRRYTSCPVCGEELPTGSELVDHTATRPNA